MISSIVPTGKEREEKQEKEQKSVVALSVFASKLFTVWRFRRGCSPSPLPDTFT